MIVKVTSWTRNRSAAKATIRYIMHRPDREGERASRTLFETDGPMEKYHGYAMIDGAKKGTVFYRIAISPDPKKHDTFKDLDLWLLTQNAMAHLKEHFPKDIQFLAVAHDDQTDVRHVNTLVLVGGRLTKEEFKALPRLLKQAAAVDAKLQRQKLDQGLKNRGEQIIPAQYSMYKPPAFRKEESREEAYASSGAAPPKITCPDCGPAQQMWQMDDEAYKCPGCGSTYELNITGGFQEEGVQLSL